MSVVLSEHSGPRPASLGLALVATLLLIAALSAAHAPLLPEAGFVHYDEFHTLDRSLAFAHQGDWWTVYSANEPSFRKPPLQYWMTAGLIEAGLSSELALHTPSFLFVPLALASVALLAHAVAPALPWAMPAAVLIHAGSAEFWRYGLSGMLETGAGLFATLALAAAILARRQPMWWYAVAAAIAVGALQKAPIGLALVALYLGGLRLAQRWHGMPRPALRSDPHFKRALRLAVLGILAWPLLQSLLHGPEVFQKFFGDQMIERFTPTGPVSNPRSLGDLSALLVAGEPVLRGLGAIAVVLLPLRLKDPDAWALPFIVAVFAGLMYLAGGHVTPRYSLVVLPILSVSIAVLIASLPKQPWVGLVGAAVISALCLGPVKRAPELGLVTAAPYAAQIAALSQAGAALLPGETLVVCTQRGPGRIVPALASAYGAKGRPFVQLRDARAIAAARADGALAGPVRGACAHDVFPSVAPLFSQIEQRAVVEGYVIFTAQGPA
ncbi:MAG: hypothetical protein AAGG09_01025 [Pseudomonadota bacterium]